MTDITTTNFQIMTELYQGSKTPKAKTVSGFSQVQQKSTIVVLTVLADAVFHREGSTISIEKGSKVLLREEDLATQKHLVKKYTIGDSEKQFMLIDFSNVVGVIQE